MGVGSVIDSKYLRLALVFLGGALLSTAFEPLGYWWIPFPILALLLVYISGLSGKAALIAGLLFGLGKYLAGVSWVYVSLHVYGGMPLWMGAIAVLGFASILAMFIALPCFLTARIFPQRKSSNTRVLLLATALLVFEWGKSWVLTGFPWLDLGYTQTNSYLFSLAPLGGLYLLSAVVLGFAACLALMVMTKSQLSILAGSAVILGVSLLSYMIKDTNWVEASGEQITVGVVQANTPVNEKWQAAHQLGVVQNLTGLTQSLINQSDHRPDFIVWPETALPFAYQQIDQKFWKSIKPPQVGLITGVVDFPNVEESYNSAIVDCDGQRQLYRKNHLVPFGEYLPLRFLFNWVLEYLELPMSDFSSGQGRQKLSCGSELQIGLSICYEDAFANEHRWMNAGANVLVNISEDAWFGDSLAPHQRLQMAQMRARELARPMIRSANSGPSAIIDEFGKIVHISAQFEPAILFGKVQPQQGETLFARFGNWIVYLAIGVWLWAIGLRLRQGRHQAKSD